jgi:hypothetical protein
MSDQKIIEEIMSLGKSSRPSGLISDLVEIKVSLEIHKIYDLMTDHEEAIARAKMNELKALLDLSVTTEGAALDLDLNKELEDARLELKDLTDG